LPVLAIGGLAVTVGAIRVRRLIGG
jgi:hypothetical protein